MNRFIVAGAGFERVLRSVQPEQWSMPTPCTEWNVRDLVNHMTRGNLNYVALLRGGTAADFIRLREADALGSEPVGAFSRSVRECAEAFAVPAALRAVLDYPLGRATGEQLLAVRTTDSVVHTWDLARAVGASEELDESLVSWVMTNLERIYADLSETPTAAHPANRFFAPAGEASPDTSQQDRLLLIMGRSPAAR